MKLKGKAIHGIEDLGTTLALLLTALLLSIPASRARAEEEEGVAATPKTSEQAALAAELSEERSQAASAQLQSNETKKQATPEGSTSGYDKGFYLRSADHEFELKIKGRVQFRASTTVVENAATNAAYSIPRARLKLEGALWGDSVSTKLQFDFGKGFVTLKDAVISWKSSDALSFSVGQFKTPFSRQELTSSGKQQFVDRAITASAFGAGRDIGLMAHNNFSHSPSLEWAVGIFNGTGDKSHFKGKVEIDPALNTGPVSGGKFSNVPDQFNPTMVLRLGYNYGKLKGYSEGDLEGGPLRAGVALSLSSDLGSPNGSFGHRQEIDAQVKVQGFSFSGALLNTLTASGTVFSSLAEGNLGARLQGGYLFMKQVEVALRWALVDPPGENDSLQEFTLGASDYIHGHNLKVQVDGGALLHGDQSIDLVMRAQAQLAF